MLETREYQYLQTFFKVSHAVTSSLKTEEILNLIVRAIPEAMGVKACTLRLLDEKTNELKTLASYGLREKYLAKGRLDADKSIADALAGKPAVILDATTDPRIQYRAEKKEEGIASILAVPVKVRDKTLGVLRLYTSEPYEFSQDEVDFVCALASQGGIALENARLYERLQENNRIFWEIGCKITSTLKAEEVLQMIVRELAKAFEVKGCAIRLLDEGTKKLQLAASYGLSEKYLSKGPVDSDQSIAEAMRGKICFVEDATRDPRVQYPRQAKEEGIVCILSVPMTLKQRVLGVLRIYTDCSREFHDTELTFISAIAAQGAIAIENAIMYETVKSNYEDLRDNLWSYRSWF